jgi:hypothetical protein
VLTGGNTVVDAPSVAVRAPSEWGESSVLRRAWASWVIGGVAWVAISPERRSSVDDRGSNVEIADLLADDDDGSLALERWKSRLAAYVDGQGALDALRLRSPSEPPWPATDNPMVEYLSERGNEIATDDSVAGALAWLARKAWFEGAIAERARIARLIDRD